VAAFVVRRLVRLMVVVIGVSLVTFAILHASGDPVTLIMPEAPEADRAVLRQTLGLHDPLAIQFARFFGNAATGNFGNSFFHRTPAFALVVERMPTTLLLTACSMALALAVALPVGIYSAMRRGRAVDQVATGTVFLGQSMPVFWTGIMLILVFALSLRWFPSAGMVSPYGGGLDDLLWHLALPALTLGTASAAAVARLTRSSVLEIIRQDYVRAARAKGLAERAVVARHVLKNALNPILTVIGVQVGYLLGGAILTETVFSWPGLGSMMVRAIQARDYPLVQGGVLLIATTFVLVNLVVDLLYAVFDPRIRYE